MYIYVQRVWCTQLGLKGQLVLVLGDPSKVQKALLWCCDDKYLIPLALKCRLSHKRAFYKQHIWPAALSKAFLKLKEINPYYEDVVIQDLRADVSEKSDTALWRLLADENVITPDLDNEVIVTDEEIEDNDHVKEEQVVNSFPAVMCNVHWPNISSAYMLNLTTGESQIPVSFTSEPNWEALAFPK